jgi:CRP-like cAMP-binding protein
MFKKLEDKIRQEIVFSNDLRTALKERAQEIKISKNELLIEQNKICRHGYFLNNGSLIQFYQNENGKQIVLGFYLDDIYPFISSPNSYFNEIGSTFEIKALEDSELIAFHKKDLEFLAGKYSEFNLFYHKITATALHNMYLYTSMRLSLSAEEYFSYLLKNHPAFISRIPDKYLAQFIGVSKEWYSKIQKKIIKGDPKI